ncbi:MAG: plasmid mobilization relaxosome protein MobC [Waterburya sp.]
MPRKVQRTKPVAVRLTDKEKLDWDLKAHAAGLSISELVRQAMERVKIHHVGDRSIQIERTRQIAKIGNNLNQIARWVNRYKTSADLTFPVKYFWQAASLHRGHVILTNHATELGSQ